MPPTKDCVFPGNLLHIVPKWPLLLYTHFQPAIPIPAKVHPPTRRRLEKWILLLHGMGSYSTGEDGSTTELRKWESDWTKLNNCLFFYWQNFNICYHFPLHHPNYKTFKSLSSLGIFCLTLYLDLVKVFTPYLNLISSRSNI